MHLSVYFFDEFFEKITKLSSLNFILEQTEIDPILWSVKLNDYFIRAGLGLVGHMFIILHNWYKNHIFTMDINMFQVKSPQNIVSMNYEGITPQKRDEVIVIKPPNGK